MAKKILIAVVAVVLLLVAFIAAQPSKFHYERSGLIGATPEAIFPYLNNLKSGSEWSPFEKVDPNMKHIYSGSEFGVGSVMEFDGNNDAGAGRIEIIKEVPNTLVQLKLDMTRPMAASNLVEYKLVPEGTATRFTWSMSGEVNFLGKAVNLFIDCEKMVGDQFNKGIESLKTLVESRLLK